MRSTRDRDVEEETETRSRGRSRDRGESREGRSESRDRDRGSARKPERKKSNKPVAINLDPDTYESYGLYDNADVEIVDAYYAPWDYSGSLKKPDGTPFHTLGLYVVYEDQQTGEEHTEPIAAGDLNYYAPGLSPNEEDYAGGTAEEFRALASGEQPKPNDDMQGEYMLPVARGYNEDGDPIYRRKTATRGSNQDFYFHQLSESAKAAGIKLAFDPDDPSVKKLLVGICGHVERMTNTLRKGGGGADFKGDKSKPLVFTEVFERKGKTKGSTQTRRSKRDEEPEDEKPARRGSRREEKESEPEPERKSREPERKSSGRGSSRKPKDDSGPDSDFLADFAEKVESALSDLPNRSSKLIKLTHLTDEYETREEAKWALDILTDDEWVDSFWSKSKLWDYNEEDNSVSL